MATENIRFTAALVTRVNRGDFEPGTVLSDSGSRLRIRVGTSGASYSLTMRIGKKVRTLTPTDEHGKPIQDSVRYIPLPAAKNWAAEQIASRLLTAQTLQAKEQSPAELVSFAVVGGEYVRDALMGKSSQHIASELGGLANARKVLGANISLAEVNTLDAAMQLKNSKLPTATKYHAYGATRRCIDFALYPYKMTANMWQAVPAPKQPPGRKRVLSPDEIRQIWEACEATPGTGSKLMQLVMAQPLRSRSEAATLRWHEVDLDAAVLTLDARRTKSRQHQRLPMTSLAVELIREQLPRHGEPRAKALVFTTARGAPDKPFNGWSKLIAALRERSGVENWSPHSFRHTVVSLMAEEHPEIAPDHLDRWLTHSASSTNTGTKAVYQHARMFQPMQRVAAAWDSLLRGYLGLPVADADNVVQLRGGAA